METKAAGGGYRYSPSCRHTQQQQDEVGDCGSLSGDPHPHTTGLPADHSCFQNMCVFTC